MKKSRLLALVLIISCALPASASVVQMETSLGSINIELFDEAAPVTVANFMNYVNDGDYVNSFFHRSVPGFVLQGGGFRFDNNSFSYVPESDYSASGWQGWLASPDASKARAEQTILMGFL